MARAVQCAHCGTDGKPGAEIVPYLVDTKVAKRASDDGWVTTRKPVHRWLCGLQTGRDCAEAWHAKFRAWRDSKTLTKGIRA